jgi:thiamine pyrophosphokinase
VVIFGLTGGLLDHTLGNFSILLRYTGSFRLIAFDAHYRIDFINSSMKFRSRPGDRVSVIPLQPALEVSYSGLKYPMREETLACGVREGTCNEALGDAFGIETSGGVLAVFRPLSAELRERLAGDNPLTL